MFGKKSDHYYQGAVPHSATNPRTIQNISNFRRVRFFGNPRCTYFSTSTQLHKLHVCVCRCGVSGGAVVLGSGVCVYVYCTVRAPSTCSFPIFKNEKKNENIL